MGTISVRVPDELEAELEAYLEDENLDRSTAIRKLLAEGLDEWRRRQALDQLAAGSNTVTKAVEMAGMSVWDFAQLAKERQAPTPEGVGLSVNSRSDHRRWQVGGHRSRSSSLTSRAT